jgi:hypothetical protein
MMNDEEYKAIRKIMDNPELADEMEKAQPGIKGQMAGYLMRSWLPVGIGRKIIMVVIIFVSFTGGVMFDGKWFLLLFALIMFSPRASAEILMLYGKIFRK